MRRIAPLFSLVLLACTAVPDPSPETPSLPLARPVDFPTTTAQAAPPAPPPGSTSGAFANASASTPPQGATSDAGGTPKEALTIQTEGPLSASEESVLKTVALCVRTASEKGSKSTRPLDVELTVDPTGRVSDVRLGQGYHPDAGKCVRSEVMKMSYPPRPEGGVQFLKYPIVEVTEED
jgi:hypothetical protein